MPKPAPPERLLRGGRRARTSVVPALALVGIALLVLEIGPARAQIKLLPPEEAFRFSARALDARTVEANFAVAEGSNFYVFYQRSEREVYQRSRQSGATPSTNPLDDWNVTFDENNDTSTRRCRTRPCWRCTSSASNCC